MMSVVPGALDTDRQPPMTVPLRHFVVALGFLLLGGLVGLAMAVTGLSWTATAAHLHFLLAGWVCITIMGAMTQFVPVWSGVRLHSRRLAAVQLWLVVIGLLGFAGALLLGWAAVTPAFGALMVFGFWVFVYNVGRTLRPLPSYDVTERHFVFALGSFVLVTALGFLLALDFTYPVFDWLSITRAHVRHAHATLAVFGAVLTTVFGALYQLATMFTQTELHGIDVHLRRFEEVGYPVGVLALAGGRLTGSAELALLGGLLVPIAVFGVGWILGRRLYETQVDWTPMLSRYAVVALAMALWALATVPVWARDPLASAALFGAPESVHLLGFGVIGFVVLGTLYHVVPFIIWVHRYSDRLGREAVPMIDDLYSKRIATLEFVLLVGGGAGLVGADWFGRPFVIEASTLVVVCGTVLFAANLLRVVRTHSPHSIVGLLFGPLPSRVRRRQSPSGGESPSWRR